jgi:hypothetical protein
LELFHFLFNFLFSLSFPSLIFDYGLTTTLFLGSEIRLGELQGGLDMVTWGGSKRGKEVWDLTE